MKVLASKVRHLGSSSARRSTPFVLFALATASCGGSRDSSQEPSDPPPSYLAENEQPRSPGIWRASAEPLFVIGDDEGEELFRVRRAAAHLSDGRLVLGVAGSAEIRIYDAYGRLESRFGRDGQGPGEFSRGLGPARAWVLPGDTIAAWEYARSLVQFFTADGAHVRSVRLKATGGIPEVAGVLDDGTIVARYAKSSENLQPGEERETREPYVWFSPEGEEGSPFAELQGFDYVRRRRPPPSPRMRPSRGPSSPPMGTG